MALDMTTYAAGVAATGAMLLDTLRLVLEQFTLYETLFAFVAVAFLGIAVALGCDFLDATRKTMTHIGQDPEMNDLSFKHDVQQLRHDVNKKWHKDEIMGDMEATPMYDDYLDLETMIK